MKHLLSPIILLCSLAFVVPAHAETKAFFSPNGGCQEAVIAQIGKARKSIDVAMYELTSRPIAQALVAAKERGVRVRIALDIFQIKDLYSKARYLIKKGVDVKFHMGPGLLHDKFAVIDDRTVLTGSYNWTMNAEARNFENMLVTTDRDLADSYREQFRHLWSQSGEGHFKKLPQEAN